MSTQRKRLLWRSAFFILFALAPVLDILRFDLDKNHLVFLGQPWVLGIDSQLGAMQLFWNMMLKFFLPLTLFIGVGFMIVWKWGRLYCGWLCPHFLVVETINGLMRRASAKPSLWEKAPLPSRQQDGTNRNISLWWWPVTLFTILFISGVWAVVLLTYLIHPNEVYHNLHTLTLTPNQFTFIGVATLLFAIEFTFARHLFCRFGCAVGLFQSLIWMANKQAMVVAFDRSRATLCSGCDKSCEHACPMRLKPRGFKRNMFTCTQCMQCVSACENVQRDTDNPPLLKMLERHCALDVSDQGLGKKRSCSTHCFEPRNQQKRHCHTPVKP
ncbi:MAG: 4Fe-4S binding protein [Candidatus Thiodiazotropha sp.]